MEPAAALAHRLLLRRQARVNRTLCRNVLLPRHGGFQEKGIDRIFGGLVGEESLCSDLFRDPRERHYKVDRIHMSVSLASI